MYFISLFSTRTHTHIDRVEVYCHAAKASLAPHGLFVMCASDLPGVEARVQRAAEDAGAWKWLWWREDRGCDMAYLRLHSHTHIGLSILRKLAVLPKRGQPPLFAVYTLCHAGGAAAEAYGKALIDAAGAGAREGVNDDAQPRVLLVDPPSAVAAEGPQVVGTGSVCMVRETLAVREAGPVGDGGGGGRVPRTAEYRRVMDDLSMPDNEV
jgi:hypothetical protein